MSINDINKIESEQTINGDGCLVLPKLQVHDIQQGQCVQLRWAFRDRKGVVVDLSSLGDSSESEVDPVKYDAVGKLSNGVVLRIREAAGTNPQLNPVYVVAAEITEGTSGDMLSAPIPGKVANRPGIYWEEWAAVKDGAVLATNRVLLWVNQGLFGLEQPLSLPCGPPTIAEIRLSVRDNAAEDNLLLDGVEFDAAEIAQAVLRPLQYWNEVPPPIRPLMDTTTFPFTDHWITGIQANLLQIAAHNYQRNDLAYTAGGVAVQDKNKAQPYLQLSQLLFEQYKNWVTMKKVEINTALFMGSVNSSYGGTFF